MPVQQEKHYYNNHFAAENGIVRIDRIYAIDESAFAGHDYDKLGEIFRALPEFVDGDGCPYWYGTDEDGFYLTLSFEPVGLQLVGRLRQNEFEDWERKFHCLLKDAGFPYDTSM